MLDVGKDYTLTEGAIELLPILFWLMAFSDTVNGEIHQIFSAIVLPDGRVVAPRVAPADVVVALTSLSLD
jgi:hypothetical protein